MPGQLARDIHFAGRQLIRARWYALAVVATMALTIGAAAAIYSAVHHVLLTPLPFRSPDRLVVVWETDPSRNLNLIELTYRYTEALGQHALSLESSTAIGSTSWPIVLKGRGDPVRLAAVGVGAGFFSTLGASPLLGRTLQPSDDVPNATPTAVLSHGLWRTRFGGDPQIVGQVVRVDDDQPLEIVGVMPENFDYPPHTDLWIPVVPVLAGPGPDFEQGLSGVGVLFMLARLRDGVTATRAREEIDRAAAGYLDAKGRRPGTAIVVTPLIEHMLGPVRPALWALLGAVVVLLLIGCSNISALMLTRVSLKQHEDGVRQALGARRWDVGRLWVAQSLLLAAAGAAAGLVLARWMVSVMAASVPPEIPRLPGIHVNAAVAAVAVLVSALTALLCAALPAWRAAHPSLAGVMSNDGRVTPDRRSHRTRALLLAGQTALTVVLLVAAALVARSFFELRRVDLGFSTDRVVTLQLEPEAPKPTPHAWFDEYLRRLGNRDGVEAAGAVYLRPLALGPIGQETAVVLEGQELSFEAAQQNPSLNYQAATPGYFTAMRIPIKEGRGFSADDTATSARVALVGESTARRLWPNGSPLGKRLLFPTLRPRDTWQWRTVIGVVSDVRYRGLDDVRLDVYDPASQARQVSSNVVVRGSGDPVALLRIAIAEARQFDPHVVVADVATLESIVSRAMAPWRFSTWVFTLFALLATLLTMIGLYSAVTLDVAARRRELAIRRALGGTTGDVVVAAVRRPAIATVLGLASGLAVSLLGLRVIRTLLFGVGVFDPLAYGMAIAATIGLALLAAALPLYRAAMVEPLAALREG